MPEVDDIYGGFRMDEKMDVMKNSCCATSMKVWLIICNVILLILALASFAIGIWVQSQPGFAWSAGSVGVGLILVGVFLLLIAALGIFAAVKESKCLFGFYGTFITIFFIVQLAALAIAIAATSILVDGANVLWDQMDGGQKDGIGMFFGCCGVDESAVADADKKYSVREGENYNTCSDGESVADDVSTHTWMTGQCTVFGMDYKTFETADNGDRARIAEVNSVSFPAYNAAFLADNSVCSPISDIQQYNTCSTLSTTASVSTTECDANEHCQTTSGSACVRAAPYESDDELPLQCLCPLQGNGNTPSADCRTSKGTIPMCSDDASQIVFPFYVGLQDEEANMTDGDQTYSAPFGACYAKLEIFLSENWAALIIIAIIFVYQFLLMCFSWALVCCIKSNKGGDEGQGLSGDI